MKQKQPTLFGIERIKNRINPLSISSKDKYFGEIRKQFNALVNSSSIIFEEVERLEGIIYPQFLNHLEKGQIRMTSSFNTSTAHADYPINCPRTKFKEFVGYRGEIPNVFGIRSIEQIVYDEIEFRSRDRTFRERIEIPKIEVPNSSGQHLSFEYDPERWKEWVLTINSHPILPYIEADFWIPSR